MKVILEIEEFIRSITSGNRLTLAQWMRIYVDKHPEYKHNSILPKKVIDDLLLTLYEISKGKIKDDNFIPVFSSWWLMMRKCCIALIIIIISEWVSIYENMIKIKNS